MRDIPSDADLDVSDAEIERLRAIAAEKTSKARSAFAAKLERAALERAVDPYGVHTDADVAERIATLRKSLDDAQLAELVAAERSRFMAEIGRKSSRNRRTRRVERLRKAAGEAA